MSGRKERIAVLGGGVGAVAAAFALTEGENAGKYDVTLYQLGWRLGGKGASGRDMREEGRRIEEHGLHVWFGFYYNALAMMERCYAALQDLPDGERNPKDTFENAFTDHDFVVLEENVDGHWKHLPIHLPRGEPERQPTPLQYAAAILRWIREQWSELPTSMRPHLPGLHDVFELVEALHPHAETHGLLDGLGAVVHGVVVRILDRVRGTVDLERELVDGVSDTVRRFWMSADLGLAIARGLIEDVVPKGFDGIDGEDVWAWLERHGASNRFRDSVIVRTFYCQAFGFPDGNTDDGQLAAGATLRAVLRMLFAYDGAFMRKMNAGMGDIVFSPFYRVLRHRGVRFKFFHRVRGLHLSADEKRIARITLGRQVRLAPGAPVPPTAPPSCCDEPEYRPLVPVADPRVGVRQCWPDEPDWHQVHPDDHAAIVALEGQGRYVSLESHWSAWGPDREHECVLEAGTHFDHVVLGISLGALSHICGELIAANADWARMIDGVQTVRTQAFQLWLTSDLAGLEWPYADGPVSTTYEEPIDTWAEMNQTLPAEAWPKGTGPKLIAYFCAVLRHDEPDPEWFTDEKFPERQREQAFGWMQTWVEEKVGYLWPGAMRDGKFRWDLLLAPGGSAGAQRLREQFWIANVEPTERYVLSVPGSTAKRLRPEASGFPNLVLAGDWTKSTLNVGCVEAAVTSGIGAAAGITHRQPKILGAPD